MHGRPRTHGHARTRTYIIWIGMKSRCHRSTAANWKLYGGRGIAVCDRWRNSFENFLADMGEAPSGMSIERVNNDGDYEPSNCKWATREEQSGNRRGAIRITYQGRTQCLGAWANDFGMGHSTLMARFLRGDRGDDLFRPKGSRGRWDPRER